MDFEQIEEIRRANFEQRKGCIIKILFGWFALMFVVIAIMVFVRGRVNRTPEVIEAEIQETITYQFPEGFRAYSMSNFMGVRLYSFWNKDHVGVDDRTTSVIALYRENDWESMSLNEVETMVLADMKDKLDRNEFRAKNSEKVTLTRDGREVVIHKYEGIAKMEADYLDAVTCYRFLDTKTGPVQVHTIGLKASFPAEAQLDALASINPAE